MVLSSCLYEYNVIVDIRTTYGTYSSDYGTRWSIPPHRTAPCLCIDMMKAERSEEQKVRKKFHFFHVEIYTMYEKIM